MSLCPMMQGPWIFRVEPKRCIVIRDGPIMPALPRPDHAPSDKRLDRGGIKAEGLVEILDGAIVVSGFEECDAAAEMGDRESRRQRDRLGVVVDRAIEGALIHMKPAALNQRPERSRIQLQ